MARSLTLVLVLVSLAGSLFGQGTTEDNPELVLRVDQQRRAEWATAWLSSGDPSRVAWGAWLARRDHAKALIPLLIQQVAQYQSADESLAAFRGDRHDALLVVLDALIQLDARISASQAHSLYAEFPAQSLILLLRAPNNTAALLDIFQKAKANWNWLASGNALAQTRAPGFAFILLNRFTQHISVSVVSPHAGVGGGAGGGSSECGSLIRAPKAGWPSVGLYQLTQFPERFYSRTATLLISGRTPVYYWRVEHGNYDNPPDAAGYCDDGNRDEYRVQYLKDLLRPSDTQLSAYPYEFIQWEGDANFRLQLREVVGRDLAKLLSVISVLQQSGTLTRAEAAKLGAHVEIVVRDDRGERPAPLPIVSKEELLVPVRDTFSKPLL